MLSSPVFLKQTHVSNLLYIHVIYGYDTKSAVFVATPAKYSIINKNYKMNTIILHFNKSPQNISPPPSSSGMTTEFAEFGLEHLNVRRRHKKALWKRKSGNEL